MVRKYVRKTNRQSWDEISMQQAVLSVINGDQGYKKAAEMYGVPQTTLERRVAKFRKEKDIVSACKKGFSGGFKTVFSKTEEDELAYYVQQMENMLFGLTPSELCGLAFQLAERNDKEHPFKKEDEAAGYDWYRGFMARHPNLSLRKPEATSAARAQGFNKVAVNQFFDLLEKIYENNDLTQERVYNCDETGVTTVPKTMSKVIATKGKSQVGGLSSAERGQLVTAVTCCSASGLFMPPMLLFPRVRMKAELMDGAPPGSTFECHPSGWIQTHLFISWMKKFIKFSGATKERKVLLILDGHATHTKSIELIDIAIDNGVIMLCLPPHCTHRMQPLDVTFMKPLSVYYEQEVKKWLRHNPGRVVTQFQISTLFGKAYLRAATMLSAINGFQTCGIYPMDRNVFSEADFLSANATDIAFDTASQQTPSANDRESSVVGILGLPPTAADRSIATEASVSVASSSTASESNFDLLPPTVDIPDTDASSSIPNEQNSLLSSAPFEISASTSAGTSAMSPHNGNAQCSSGPSFGITDAPATPERQSIGFNVSPQMLMPYPKQNAPGEKRVSRKRGKTVILTSSPYKKALEEDQAKKRPAPSKSASTAKQACKKNPPKMKGKGKGASKRSEEDVNCLYCDGKWSESGESWVRCGDCELWAHYSCAGIDEDDRDPDVLCEMCFQTEN